MDRIDTHRDHEAAAFSESPRPSWDWAASASDGRGMAVVGRHGCGALAIAASDPFAQAQGMLPAKMLADRAALPDALSDVLKRLDGRVTSADVCRSLIACVPDAPLYLREALVDVALAADMSGAANAYHNPVHSRDVGVIFANLMRIQTALTTGAATPDPVDFLAGCCAAFGHDIGHDGSDSPSEPFRLERIAADLVCAIMEHHSGDLHLIERVYCAILSTDVHNGYRALDEAARGILSTDVPACLRGLTGAKNRELASLLRDADVMQSAGLTPDDHDRQTARLERERGIPRNSMGARGADFFLSDLIQGRFLSEAGRIFQPRLDRLLRLNAMRAEDGQGPGGLAAFDQR